MKEELSKANKNPNGSSVEAVIHEFAPCKENWKFNNCGVLIISGQIATGKTTLVDTLSKMYRIPAIKIGKIIRQITDTLKKEGPIDRTENVDSAMDALQKEIIRNADANNPQILESRFAAIIASREKETNFQKKSPPVSILLTASKDATIDRILSRNSRLSKDDAGKKLRERSEDDLRLAKEKFGDNVVNLFGPEYFDLTIDTDEKTPKEVVEIVHNWLLEKGYVVKKEDHATPESVEYQVFPISNT